MSDQATPSTDEKAEKPSLMAAEAYERVDGPKHYGGKDNPYEVIKVLRNWLTREEFIGALKFNIHKYLARAEQKSGSEDYEKGAWYANYLAKFVHECPKQGRTYFVKLHGKVVNVIPEYFVESFMSKQAHTNEGLSALLRKASDRIGELEAENESLRRKVKSRDKRIQSLREASKLY